MKVKDVMTRNVIIVRENEKIKDVSKKFAENNISGAPVANQHGKLVGIVSEADILRLLRTHYTRLDTAFLPTPFDLIEIPVREAMEYVEVRDTFKDIGNKKVSEIMKKHVITIEPDATVEDASMLMVRKKVNRLPVVKNKRLVGIITRGDIVQGLAKTSSSSSS